MGLFNHSRRTQARQNHECAMQIKAELEQSRDLKIQLLALPFPRAEGGLLWEDALSPFPRLHAAHTSDLRVDVAEPICSASIGQPLNLMKAAVAVNHR